MRSCFKISILTILFALTEVSASSTSLSHLPVFAVKDSKQLLALKKDLRKRSVTPLEATWNQSQIALWDGIFDNNASSIGTFERLKASPSPAVDKDRMHLNYARVLYQKGDLEAAIAEYNQVSKGSDYWIEAVEERAWAYLRLDKPEKTLAQVKSLFAPIFANQVGPEPFFLAAFTHLKICDYYGVFEDIASFKKTFKDRIGALEKLASEGHTKESMAAVEKLAAGPYKLKTVAQELPALPRLFHRDQFIQRSIERYAKTKDEEARQDVYRRLKYLAEAEVKEIAEIVRKLHIVEAEVIQRIHIHTGKDFGPERGEKIARNHDTMVFPVTKEIWLDEIDSYQMRIKDCPKVGGKTL